MGPEERNPYRWTGTDIEVHIPRGKLLDDVRKELLQSRGSGCLLGATGMGKSVFLKDLEEDLRRIPGVLPVLFPIAPVIRTLEAIQGDLIDKLVEKCGGGHESLVSTLRDLQARPDPRKVIESFLARRPDVQVLVLLYDELDDYADDGGNGRQWIKNLEATRRENSQRLKLFVAGGLRVFSVGDSYASPFLSRSRRFLMPPFTKDELSELAKPLLEKQGSALSPDTLDQILMLSGGNAALSIYALQELWEGERDVVAIYEKFKREDGGLLPRIRKAVADESVSKLPSLFWDAILRSKGALRQDEVEEIVSKAGNELLIDVKGVIELLQSAGLVRLESSIDDDPIRVRPVPSILNFKPRRKGREASSLREQLVKDVTDILSLLHAMSLDFVQGGSPAREDLFSAFIASNLLSRGWVRAEREPIMGSGYADIKAMHGRFPDESAVIEVKIWPRNHQGIHGQVAAYWIEGVEAGAAIMVDVRQDVTGWQSEYEAQCLNAKASGWTWQQKKKGSPLHAHALAESTLPSGVEIKVDHFLLHLQSAPTSKKAKAKSK